MTAPAQRRAVSPVPVTAWLLMALGVAVVAGWVFDVPRLKGVLPYFATMKINAALCFFVAGAALLLRHRSRRGGPRWLHHLGALAAAAVLAVGTVTVLQYVLDTSFGIDELLIEDPRVGPVGVSGRMSVITATGFVLFGLAMLLPPGRRSGALFSLLCSAGLVIAFLAAMGYLYNVRMIFQPLPATAIAVHGVAGLAIMFLGALASRPAAGWLGVYLRPGSIGLVVRTLVPVVVLLPVLVGWLGLQGVRAGHYGPAGQTALVVTACSLLLAAVTLLVARRGGAIDDSLQEQRRLYASVLGNSLDAFIMIDQDDRVLEWNDEAERIFGWRADEVMGRRVDELVIPEAERAAHRRGLARFIATGEGPLLRTRANLTARRRSGETFPVELIIVPLAAAAGWRFAAFLRDITEQLAVEAQLRQAQKMDAVGQLTGGIAHDLNNLLTVVIGNLDLAASGADTRTRRHVEPALQAAERGAALVHRLLAFSRRQPLAPEAVDLNALVHEVHELLRRSLGDDVDIELQLADDLWPVFADPAQVESALLNLAVNARDAMPGGGKLTIETGNAALDADYAAANPGVEPGDYAMLAVTDTGVGMSHEVLEHAFEPFFTTKEVGKGSGLGLSMIYGFAKQSRGHAKIYSEAGHGTTVRLYLPRDQAAEQGAAPDPAPADVAAPDGPTSGRATVLVVEDDEAVRGFVVAVLESAGHRVLVAADAAQALDELAAHPEADLLFTDVVIPGGMSGSELAAAARARVPGLPVLFTSGYTENAIVHQGKLDPGVDFIAKPYRRDELIARVRAALDAGTSARR